jgi:hypothetical protein
MLSHHTYLHCITQNSLNLAQHEPYEEAVLLPFNFQQTREEQYVVFSFLSATQVQKSLSKAFKLMYDMVGKHYRHGTPFPKIYTDYYNANLQKTLHWNLSKNILQALEEEKY